MLELLTVLMESSTMGTKQDIIQFEFGASAPSLLNQAISIHGVDFSSDEDTKEEFGNFQRDYSRIYILFSHRLLTKNEYEKAIKRLNIQINNYINSNKLQ